MDGGQATRPSLPDLLAQFVDDVTGLVRKEGELIRAELEERVGSVAQGVANIAAGGLVLTAALLVLLQALVLALSKVMDPAWAALLVGVSVAGVGWLLVRSGLRAVSLKALSPERSARQLRRTAELMTGRDEKDAGA
jgi:hypothetical protein